MYKRQFPQHLLKGLGEIGAFGPYIPQEYGGAGLDQIAYGLIMQELERCDSGLRSTASVQSSLVMYPIYKYGSEEQRKKYLPKLATGEWMGCFGLTEPDFGSNPAGMVTNFKDKGDHYLLNGAKMWISNAPFAQIAVVWAKNEEGRIHGLIVERGMEGFSTPTMHGKWSLRASDTGELIFDNVIAKIAEELGYNTILTESVDRILKNRSPHQAYAASNTSHIKVLLRDYHLSDDISFRFSDKSWQDYPITVKKYVAKLKKLNPEAETVNLFMDYENFGEHQPESSGIFAFLKNLVSECIDNQGYTFKSPQQISEMLKPKDEYSVEDYISWADTERDLSAWLSNSMQYEALHKIYALRTDVLKTENEDLIKVWSRLQTSDHYYYMCTKYWADGDVHKYFSPYNSPYDAYIFFMNILSDFELLVKKALKGK